MATIAKKLLSGSTDGEPIKVAATATAGTLLHTAVAGTTDTDLVDLYACNTQSADVTLTLEWGGTTSPDHLLEIVLPGEAGAIKITSQFPLQNGKIIRAFASSANVVNIWGSVNRIDA